jgi:hypothetical protein
MKRKMIWLIVSLMFLSAMVLVSAQNSVQIGPYGNLRIGPYRNLKIGPYGNLVGLTDTQGKDVLGEIRAGFEIAYQMKNREGTSEDRLVYAVGDQPAKGLTIEGKKSTNSSKVVATQDKALEITSQFTYDEKAQELVIDRSVMNISAETVDLQITREYVDAKLVPGPSQGKKPMQLDTGWIKAGRRDPDDCQHGKCDPPPPPPCHQLICPWQNGYRPPELITEPSGITLQWRDGTSLAPHSSGDAPRSANVAHYIVHVPM